MNRTIVFSFTLKMDRWIEEYLINKLKKKYVCQYPKRTTSRHVFERKRCKL